MSVSIDYFFNYPKSLPELAEDLNAWLGCSLAPYEGDAEDLFDRFLGMEFSLGTAEEYVNDRELDFENFQYELGFRVPVPDGDLRAIHLPAMLMVVYVLYQRRGIAGMLVKDVQTLLARYEEREIPGHGRRLYDVLSGTPFTRFADHLAVVQQGIPGCP